MAEAGPRPPCDGSGGRHSWTAAVAGGGACSCDGLMVGEGAQKQRTHTSTERMHTDTVWGQRGGQEDLGSPVW